MNVKLVLVLMDSIARDFMDGGKTGRKSTIRSFESLQTSNLNLVETVENAKNHSGLSQSILICHPLPPSYSSSHVGSDYLV